MKAPIQYIRIAPQILFLASLLTTSIIRAELTYSEVSFPGNVKRSNVTQQVGARFWNTSGEPVVITQLGRWVTEGNRGKHTIRIYGDYGELLGSTVVDCSGVAPGQFVWGKLNSPAVVAVGYRAYILTEETAGGDEWFNAFGGNTANNQIVRVEDIGDIESAHLDTATGKLAATGGMTFSHGPISFKYTSPTRKWTKTGNRYTTDGTYYQISSAIRNASPGDTVSVPPGVYTWGEGATTLVVKSGVTLEGAGVNQTIINMHPTSASGYGSSLIVLNEGSTIRGFTFNGPDAANTPLIRTGTANDWRVSQIEYKQFPGRAAYFVNIQGGSRGLIDQCTITGGAGNSELVFMRGPSNSWDLPHTLGTADNVFIEDCTWNGDGYVCDANSAARMVVRYNTINGRIKIDGHGVWSNGNPQRGVRHMEVYGNRWTNTAQAWTAVELRGGGGMVFDNRSDLATGTNGAWFFVTEYGVFNNNGAFTPNHQTPADWPIRDQIGRGRYATAGDWKTATAEPMYLWGNRKGGNPWPWSYKAIPQAAIDRYRAQTGNANATFTWEDVIKADRDYFNEVPSFNGSSGVGIGTKAQMNAIQGSKPGVGFWVTDEGTWNQSPGGQNGQLYTWTGSSWALKYVPYTYPHPLRDGVSATPSPTVEPPRGATIQVTF